MFNTQLHTLGNDLLGHVGVGKDENSIHLLRDGIQVRVAGIPLVFADPRINRINLIPVLFEFFITQIATRIALIRNTHHGDLLLSKKITNHTIDSSHFNFLLGEESEPDWLRSNIDSFPEIFH